MAIKGPPPQRLHILQWQAPTLWLAFLADIRTAPQRHWPRRWVPVDIPSSPQTVFSIEKTISHKKKARTKAGLSLDICQASVDDLQVFG